MQDKRTFWESDLFYQRLQDRTVFSPSLWYERLLGSIKFLQAGDGGQRMVTLILLKNKTKQ